MCGGSPYIDKMIMIRISNKSLITLITINIQNPEQPWSHKLGVMTDLPDLSRPSEALPGQLLQRGASEEPRRQGKATSRHDLLRGRDHALANLLPRDLQSP